MASATHERRVEIGPVSARDADADTLAVAGLLFGALGAAFLTGTMLAASIAPDYDFGGGAISDLGVIGETALLFNGLLLVIGILNAVGGGLFYAWHRRAWLLALYLLGGVGAIGAGVLPLDTGGPHTLFALLGFVFINLEAIGTGFVLRGSMRALSLLAGAIGLVFVGVMIVGDGGNPAVFGPIGHGGAERMIVYPAMLWLLVLGGYLVARHEVGS